MPRTKGALGKKTIAKQSEAQVSHADSYSEAFTGSGTNRDRSSYTRPKRGGIMDQNTLQDLYMSDGFARRVVDVPAEEMTRSGVEIEDLEDDELKKFIESRLDELDALRHMNDAVRWSRLFGGALLIYGINDGGTLDVPLNPGAVKDVEFLRVYDRYQTSIQTRNMDVNSIDYGKPELWLISPHAGGSPYTVHNSRVHMFDGDSIPDRLREANQGWGASSLQAAFTQLVRLGMAHQWTSAILERSQQAVQGIPGLSTLLRQAGGSKAMQDRIDVVDMVRGILNTIVIDAQETYTVQSTPVTGYSDLLDRFAEALSAVTGIPVPVLMGRSSGGLSNTDKGTLDAWYARIESMWNDILRKPEDRLISYLMIGKKGVAPEYKLCMRSLAVLSAKEEAEIDKLEAEADKLRAETDEIYMTANVIDQNEVRDKRSEDYGIEQGSAPPEPEPDETSAGNLNG